MSIPELLISARSRKISMVTCYDFWSAQIIEKSPVDMVLVGDSLSMIMHGQDSTVGADMEVMALHVKAVAKGLKSKVLIGDLPFLSYRGDLNSSIANVKQLMQAGAHGVKLEGAKGNLDLISHLSDSGVPVMGHLGLTPQFVHQFGGFKVQGKSQEAKAQILKDASDLEKAGVFSLVLECVPSQLAEEVTARLKIPTIGIGAGPHCGGQVLVLQDLLGMNPNFQPRFVRPFMNGQSLILEALTEFSKTVQSGDFPNEKESYL